MTRFVKNKGLRLTTQTSVSDEEETTCYSNENFPLVCGDSPNFAAVAYDLFSPSKEWLKSTPKSSNSKRGSSQSPHSSKGKVPKQMPTRLFCDDDLKEEISSRAVHCRSIAIESPLAMGSPKRNKTVLRRSATPPKRAPSASPARKNKSARSNHTGVQSPSESIIARWVEDAVSVVEV